MVRQRKPSSTEGTRGGRAREGDYSPSRKGGVWGASLEIILSASICVFSWGFMRLGQDFSRFGHNLLLEKIFLVVGEIECWA